MSTFRAHDGLELYYEVHGTGEPLVLLGGIMMSAASWMGHVPVLSRHVQLILLDLRDQGRSGRMKDEYSIDVHTGDVVKLLDELGIEKAHLMGVSYGGQVAQRVACTHPERIKTLILANVNYYITNLLAEIGRAWEVAARLYDGERFFQLAVPYIYSRAFYAKHLEALHQRQAMFKSALTREWFDGFTRLCHSAIPFRMSAEDLRRLTMPTLLLAAEEDLLTPQRVMEEMAEAIPQAEFVSLPGAGHGACLERPGDFLTVVIGFLTKHKQA
ncbi:MAG: alpha/beta fold hydrolase [Candidatus Bipolaricaulota bacterium]